MACMIWPPPITSISSGHCALAQCSVVKAHGVCSMQETTNQLLRTPWRIKMQQCQDWEDPCFHSDWEGIRMNARPQRQQQEKTRVTRVCVYQRERGRGREKHQWEGMPGRPRDMWTKPVYRRQQCGSLQITPANTCAIINFIFHQCGLPETYFTIKPTNHIPEFTSSSIGILQSLSTAAEYNCKHRNPGHPCGFPHNDENTPVTLASGCSPAWQSI